MYVLDYHRQVELINEMVQLRKNDEKWEAYYHHPSTNEMWKSFFPRANGEKRGPKIMRVEPVPEKLGDRLEQCLQSENSDNAVGLGLELSAKPQKWDRILTIIEDNYREYDRTQMKAFLKKLGIFNYEKIVEEMGLNLQEFGLTKKKMKKFVWRARKVLFKKLILFW